jgi:hypothetical protein
MRKEQAAFEAAYAGEDTGSGAVVEQTKVEPTEKEAPATGAQAANATEHASESSAAAPAVKQSEPDRFDAIEKRMQAWMREQGGVIGGMKDQVARMSNAARTTAAAQGAAAPSKEQIEAATKNSEKWTDLKEKYPEWAEAFEGQISITEQRILGKIPKIDPDAIRNDAVKASSESARTEVSQFKAVIPLYVKYPEWETTINTPEFMNHALSGGPSAEEYAAYKQLEQSQPAKAGETLNELIRRFPNWWSEKGSKIFSPSATDAISLLDSFNEAAQAAANEQPADKGRQANKARLESAIAPTNGATRVKQVKSDQQEFEEAFYS